LVMTHGIVMAGLRPGHPRLWYCPAFKSWMPATGAGMTSGDAVPLVWSS